MKWKLPDDVNPPDTVCVQFQVPNDPAYLAAFWGQFIDLATWYNWDRDNAHTARLAAGRMREMYLAAQLNNCSNPIIVGGGFEVDDVNIKQDPDNPCLLREVCPDGSLGCVVFDTSLCKPNTAPGGGSTPPGAGTCQDYEFSIDTSLTTLMPFVVNSGDTLKITKATGAAAELYVWYCPDGEYYLLGGCAGGAHPVGADPLNTFNHMALIWKIGSSYYGSAIGSTLTVPGGVTNAQVWLQLNASDLTIVGGTELVDIIYCNNATPPVGSWCDFLDFTISPYSGVGSTDPDSNGHRHPNPYWIGGSGWQADTTLIAPSTTYENEPRIAFDLGAPTLINYAQIDGNVAVSASGVYQVAIQASNDPTFTTGVVVIVPSIFPSSGSSFSAGGAITPVTYRYVRVYCDTYSHPAASVPSVTFTQLTLKGTGTDPGLGAHC